MISYKQLSKTKLVYEKRTDNADEEDEIAFITAVAGDTITYVGECLRAADSAIRQVAISCYVCVARSIIAGGNIARYTHTEKWPDIPF